MGIQFDHVSYSYPGFKTSYEAIKDISLSIDGKGEFIAIVGQTGSGKSTLVQHMNALLLPGSGSVNVFGFRLPPGRKEKINHLRQRVGLVFQFPEYQLFEETVIKDIMFGPKNFHQTDEDAHRRAEEAARKVGLSEDIFEKSPFRISGGQMRRVAIAGILAMEPDILVLDEPTRGLDPVGRNELMEVFRTLHEEEDKTIIIISHDMDLVAEHAKRIIVLDEGKVVFDGTREALFESATFASYHLDLPTPLKIMNHLSKTTGIPYKPVYDFESLLSHLREAGHE
jgi:energy-coupling factor transport system ATP-binding protein